MLQFLGIGGSRGVQGGFEVRFEVLRGREVAGVAGDVVGEGWVGGLELGDGGCDAVWVGGGDCDDAVVFEAGFCYGVADA